MLAASDAAAGSGDAHLIWGTGAEKMTDSGSDGRISRSSEMERSWASALDPPKGCEDAPMLRICIRKRPKRARGAGPRCEMGDKS